MANATWNIGGGRVLGPAPFLVSGIVNVTPDSFFDGGRHAGTAAAIAQGTKLAQDGAHILDVGGESTRPGAEPVSLDEELARVIPVVQGLAALLGTPRENAQGVFPVVSVDTFKGQVAARAIEAGASIVNDISGCRFDPELLDVVAQMKPGYVLMHSLDRPERMQENPKYDDVLGEIMEFFAERLRVLTGAGLPESHIVLDPGIGFGKTPEHNIFLLKHIDRLTEFGLPLYVGLSNKSVWGALLQLPLEKRLHATVAATAIMHSKGVFVHRVHDAAAAHQALSVAAGIV